MSKRIFTYEEAAALLPEVEGITSAAVAEVEELVRTVTTEEEAEKVGDRYQAIVSRWAEAMAERGIEVKGLWLIDFDNGSGYYCWRYPEASLQYFHGYEEGFAGRVKLN